MTRILCITLCTVHVLVLAICTYIAAIEIESIVVTGWICSITGIATGIAATKFKKPLLANGFALGLLGLTFVGLTVALYAAVRRAAA